MNTGCRNRQQEAGRSFLNGRFPTLSKNRADYNNRLHVGATSWFIFAEREYNPFWQISTKDDCPTSKCTKAPWGSIYEKMWGSKTDENLATMRLFRDTILNRSEIGEIDTSLIYHNSSEILFLLNNNRSLVEETTQIVNALLPGISSLLEGDEINISKYQLDKIDLLLMQLKAQASPKLKTAIEKIRRDIKKGEIFKQLRINMVE